MSQQAFSSVICRYDTRQVHRPSHRDINWMFPVQGKSPPVQVKEPYGIKFRYMYAYLQAFILQPGVYKVHLLIILERGFGSIYIEKERKKRKSIFVIFLAQPPLYPQSMLFHNT